jgi:hypothetical protein
VESALGSSSMVADRQFLPDFFATLNGQTDAATNGEKNPFLLKSTDAALDIYDFMSDFD